MIYLVYCKIVLPFLSPYYNILYSMIAKWRYIDNMIIMMLRSMRIVKRLTKVDKEVGELYVQRKE